MYLNMKQIKMVKSIGGDFQKAALNALIKIAMIVLIIVCGQKTHGNMKS